VKIGETVFRRVGQDAKGSQHRQVQSLSFATALSIVNQEDISG
jgi:hypothetical protein